MIKAVSPDSLFSFDVNVSDEFFTKQYHTLLKVPEYLRYFQCAAIGAVYTFLTTRLNRTEENRLPEKYRNNSNYVRSLGKFYSNGYVAAYCTDAELEEATLYDKRTLQKVRAELLATKLIKLVKGEKGFYYILGERLKVLNYDGYSVGDRHEGMYIQAWISRAKESVDKFRAFLREKLGKNGTAKKSTALKVDTISTLKHTLQGNTDKSTGVSSSDIELAALAGVTVGKPRRGRAASAAKQKKVAEADESAMNTLFQDSDREEDESIDVPEAAVEETPSQSGNYLERRNLVHETAKSVALETAQDESPQAAPGAEETAAEFASIVDIHILDTIKHMPELQTPQYERPPKTAEQIMFDRVKAAPTPTGAIRHLRAMLSSKHMDERDVRTVLYKLWTAKKRYHVEGFPRMAVVSTFYADNEGAATKVKEDQRLTDIYFAMREDILKHSATSIHSNEYSKVRVIAKDLLTKYPYEQVVWSLLHTCTQSVSDAKFTAQNPGNLAQLVGRQSNTYHVLMEEKQRLALERTRLQRMDEESKSKVRKTVEPLGKKNDSAESLKQQEEMREKARLRLLWEEKNKSQGETE